MKKSAFAKTCRLTALGLSAMMVFSLTACSGGGKESNSASGGDSSAAVGTMDQITLGQDNTDLSADLKVLTHRTDIVDTVFAKYVEDFQKEYPNINITYESITDYAESMQLRLSTNDWGDICMIPTTIDKVELPDKFVSFGKKDVLEKEYVMLNNFAYQNEVYGIPSVGNAQGIVYNKKVFEDAGITEPAKTPDAFLADLEKIKENTGAIPLYTNFAAGWTLGAWDAYIGGSATGDPDFMNNGIVHGDNPFSRKDDMTGPYAVYYVLYESVARGLTEDDPTTTDWEGSKGMLNRGEIGAMVLGSWAVVQMQEAGEHADDIGYMSFPITVGGKQYATAGPDYCFGINKNISDTNKTAAMTYVKWLTEVSNFAYDEGGVPIPVGAEYPEVLSAFDGIELVIDNPAPEGEETLFNDINNGSEIGLNSDQYPKAQIVEHALQNTKTLDEIMEDWNERWTSAQENYGAK